MLLPGDNDLIDYCTFFSGVGTGIAAAILADISRVTSVEERTKVMSTFMAIRQIGLIMGECTMKFFMIVYFVSLP